MVDPAVRATYPLRLGRSFDSKVDSSNERFYALQYSFKPDSIDRSRPMTLAKDNEQFYIEQCQENKDQKQGPDGSAQNRRYFDAQQSEAAPAECLLLYDESTNSFILDHLASTLRLNPSRRSHKGTNSVQPSSSVQPAGEHNSNSKIPDNNNENNLDSPSEVALDNAFSSQSNTEKLPLRTHKDNDVKPISSKVKAPSKAKQAKLPSTPPLRRPQPITSQIKKPDPGQNKSTAPTKPKAKKQVSEISLPPTSSVGKVDTDDEDDDLDLLANELEDSLGNDSKTEGNQMVVIQDTQDKSHTADSVENASTMSSSSDKSRPISLRQFTFAKRPNEEELSSSEEE